MFSNRFVKISGSNYNLIQRFITPCFIKSYKRNNAKILFNCMQLQHCFINLF
jgi:hypothetical protein